MVRGYTKLPAGGRKLPAGLTNGLLPTTGAALLANGLLPVMDGFTALLGPEGNVAGRKLRMEMRSDMVVEWEWEGEGGGAKVGEM